jgi:hypothetical protein
LQVEGYKSGFRVFAANDDAGAFGTDRLVVGVPVGNIEDLPGGVCRRLAVLIDGEGTVENETPDCEVMVVMPLARSWLEALVCDLGVTIGLELASNSLSFI